MERARERGRGKREGGVEGGRERRERGRRKERERRERGRRREQSERVGAGGGEAGRGGLEVRVWQAGSPLFFSLCPWFAQNLM